MPYGFGLLAVIFVLLAMFFHEPWVMGLAILSALKH
jgi:hypothetical protein